MIILCVLFAGYGVGCLFFFLRCIMRVSGEMNRVPTMMSSPSHHWLERAHSIVRHPKDGFWLVNFFFLFIKKKKTTSLSVILPTTNKNNNTGKKGAPRVHVSGLRITSLGGMISLYVTQFACGMLMIMVISLQGRDSGARALYTHVYI